MTIPSRVAAAGLKRTGAGSAAQARSHAREGQRAGEDLEGQRRRRGTRCAGRAGEGSRARSRSSASACPPPRGARRSAAPRAPTHRTSSAAPRLRHCARPVVRMHIGLPPMQALDWRQRTHTLSELAYAEDRKRLGGIAPMSTVTILTILAGSSTSWRPRTVLVIVFMRRSAIVASSTRRRSSAPASPRRIPRSSADRKTSRCARGSRRRKRSCAYRSRMQFWIGVPVTDHRVRASSVAASLLCLEFGFLMKCASSRTTRSHLTCGRPLAAAVATLCAMTDTVRHDWRTRVKRDGVHVAA